MIDTFEKRLYREYLDLTDKIEAIEAAIEKGDEFKKKIGDKQFELLTKQLEWMKLYLNVLDERIVDLDLVRRWDEEHFSNFLTEDSSETYIDRNKVIEKAYTDCMRELYRKAQPSASYDEYVRQYKAGELRDDDADRVYNRHYLSTEEYEYILDKYIHAYGMEPTWWDNCDTVINYLNNGALRDKWIDEEEVDGICRPGYRSYEKLPDIKDIIADIIKSNEGKSAEEIGGIIKEAVINRITDCRDFYRFDREAEKFRLTIGLGASPTCNKEAVEKYWKGKGVDVKIEEHDSNTLWEKDYYGDDYESQYEDFEPKEE